MILEATSSGFYRLGPIGGRDDALRRLLGWGGRACILYRSPDNEHQNVWEPTYPIVNNPVFWMFWPWLTWRFWRLQFVHAYKLFADWRGSEAPGVQVGDSAFWVKANAGRQPLDLLAICQICRYTVMTKIYAYMDMCVYRYTLLMSIYIYVCINTYIHLCIHLYIHIHVYIHIFIDICIEIRMTRKAWTSSARS